MTIKLNWRSLEFNLFYFSGIHIEKKPFTAFDLRLNYLKMRKIHNAYMLSSSQTFLLNKSNSIKILKYSAKNYIDLTNRYFLYRYKSIRL